MFCPNCGNEVREGAAFCPNCGNRIGGGTETKTGVTDAAKETAPVTKKRPEKKKGKGKIIALVVVAVIVVAVIALFLSSGGEDEASEKAVEFCEEVQNGYLGNYDTVTLQTVMEEVYPDGDWNYGTSNDGTYYIVEYTEGDEIDIQFTVYDDGSETFTVSGFDIPYDTDTESYSEEDVAMMLNAMYYAYADANDCGISVGGIDLYDTLVLSGHFGPVEEAVTGEEPEAEEEEMEDADDGTMTEEELLQSLSEDGYDKFTTADDVRGFLYEFDTEHTEDEIRAMNNDELYEAFSEFALTNDVAKEMSSAYIDYSQVYDYAFGEVNEAVEYGYYCLWDLNEDGVYELILGHGESSADYVNDVWTVGDDGSILGVGSFYGDTMFYKAPDGNGIYSVYGHMNYQIITRITMVDGEIAEEVISEGELAEGEDYYTSELEIYLSDISDRSLLEQY